VRAADSINFLSDSFGRKLQISLTLPAEQQDIGETVIGLDTRESEEVEIAPIANGNYA